jgi:hypothetical protein
VFWNQIFFCPSHPHRVALARLGNKNLLNQLGQSMVEYILLLAVVISLVYTVINSGPFQNLIGESGSFPTMMKNEMEWNYRFGSQGNGGVGLPFYAPTSHPTYWNTQTGFSHFIGPLKQYPQ